MRWALDLCVQRRVEVIAAAGDLTAAGELIAVNRIRHWLNTAAVPFVSTPGNAELRTPDVAARARSELAVPATYLGDGWSLLSVDTANGSVSACEKTRVEKTLGDCSDAVVLLTHWPPYELPCVDAAWLEAVGAAHPVQLLVAGHKHFDAVSKMGGIPVHLVRGLDPDKAKHAPPAVAVFRQAASGSWQRQDIAWPAGDPRTWGVACSSDFAGWLGVSTMSRTLPHLREATAAAVPCVELRADAALQCDQEELAGCVQRWRASGGNTLSVHTSDLRWEDGNVAGDTAFAASVDLALRLQADRLTVHVPSVCLEQMVPNSITWNSFAAAFAGLLEPVAAAGMVIGVENMHMRAGEPRDDRRGFGYLPDECMAWVRQLRDMLPGATVGLHLDLGHARNNAPWSQRWTLGHWYAAVGSEVVGYHVHQINANGNHQPLHQPFGPLMSLSSFFWGWSTGQLAHAPVFLEIRGEPGRVSRQYMLHYLGLKADSD